MAQPQSSKSLARRFLGGMLAIPETAGTMAGNLFFDVGATGAQALADPGLFVRAALGNRELAEEFQADRTVRRERLPELGVSAPTQAAQQQVIEAVAPTVRRVAERYPNATESVVDYLNDPSVQTTLQGIEALGLPVMRGARGFETGLRETLNGDTVGDVIGGMMAVRQAPGADVSMTLYHGSPHEFDRFDSSKIGTGEGAQAFGHGIYLAESPDVAQAYRPMKTVRTLDPTLHQYAGHSARNYVKNANGDVAKAIEQLEKDAVSGGVQFADAAKGLREGTIDIEGSILEVDVPDEAIGKMLDWDAPLTEQPKNVQDAIRKTTFWDEGPVSGEELLRRHGDMPGRNVYDLITEGNYMTGAFKSRPEQMAEASRRWTELGVPGLRYLDQVSRDAGDGTRNIVVFDDSLITPLKRNGAPVVQPLPDFTPAPQGALSAAERQIETRFFQSLTDDLDGAIKRYEALPSTRNGTIIAVDEARELLPEYRQDRSLSAAVHEPASAFAKELWRRKLAQPGDKPVLLMSGGTGAGKTTGLKFLDEDYHAILDSNLADFDKAVTKIDEALATGKNVELVHVWRDPREAFSGAGGSAITRAMKNGGNGRPVPLRAHVGTHVGSNQTVKRLVEHYKGNSRVDVHIVDNSNGKAGAKLAGPEVIPDQIDAKALMEAIRADLEAARRTGRINEKVYRGFLGTAEQG